jgi:hypothetical protein
VEVKAWPSGKVSSGRAYIMLCNESDRVNFDRSTGIAEIELGDRIAQVPLSPSFWNHCPELRDREITAWLKENGFVPWRKGSPPRFCLLPLGGNRFRLMARKDAGDL